MKVVIYGAGLAGLGLAWHLLERGVEVILQDPKGVAGGASGVSTGLLHPFAGKKALRSWRAKEGMEASQRLIRVSEAALGRPVVAPKGIFRPAISGQQKIDFRLRTEEDAEAEWREIFLPETGPMEGLWIEEGMTVYSRPYLEGLWKACEKKGARFSSDKGDIAVIAAGHETVQFPGCEKLPLKPTLGQTLVCRWDKPLPFSLVSQGHITPTEDPALCQVGSTYEHTPSPDPKKALELLGKVALFYPPAAHFPIVEIRSGVRMTQIDTYHPLMTKIDPKTWVFTGLGSRGMLYHAYLGSLLAKQIVDSSPL